MIAKTADTPLAVIDDEPAIRRLVARVFSKRSGVETFESAEDFLERFDASRPHLMIVDKNLPGLSGLELVERHRERQPAEFEAVLITGYADGDSALSAMKLGIYSYLRKPFQTEELVYALGGAEERLQLKLQLQRTESRLNREQQYVGETIGGFAEDLRALREQQLERAMTDRLGALGRVAASVAEELERSFVTSEEELLTGLVPALTAAADAIHEQQRREEAGGSSSAEELATAAVQGHISRMKALAADLRVLTDDGARDTVIDLRDVVRVGTRMASSVVQRRAELVVDVPEAPVRIYGSHQHLAQVVINLLLNSADALVGGDGEPVRQSGVVSVRIEHDPPFAVLAVNDNGCGIAEHRLQEIFEPFVGNKRGGKGVGLTIVHNIVAEHMGQVELDSVQGQGTEVRVRLPLARRPKTDQLQTVATGERPAVAGRALADSTPDSSEPRPKDPATKATPVEPAGEDDDRGNGGGPISGLSS